MASALGKYFKAPVDVKRYTIDYSNWLDAGELVSTTSFTVTPQDASPVIITGIALNTAATGIVFYASGGIAGSTYTALVTMASSGGQTKEDAILFIVRTPQAN
jgi:hypothetical protein